MYRRSFTSRFSRQRTALRTPLSHFRLFSALTRVPSKLHKARIVYRSGLDTSDKYNPQMRALSSTCTELVLKPHISVGTDTDTMEDIAVHRILHDTSAYDANTCLLCETDCKTPFNLESHKQGAKHKKRWLSHLSGDYVSECVFCNVNWHPADDRKRWSHLSSPKHSGAVNRILERCEQGSAKQKQLGDACKIITSGKSKKKTKTAAVSSVANSQTLVGRKKFLKISKQYAVHRFDDGKLDEWIEFVIGTVVDDRMQASVKGVFGEWQNAVCATVSGAYHSADLFDKGADNSVTSERLRKLMTPFREGMWQMTHSRFASILQTLALNCCDISALVTQLNHCVSQQKAKRYALNATDRELFDILDAHNNGVGIGDRSDFESEMLTALSDVMDGGRFYEEAMLAPMLQLFDELLPVTNQKSTDKMQAIGNGSVIDTDSVSGDPIAECWGLDAFEDDTSAQYFRRHLLLNTADFIWALRSGIRRIFHNRRNNNGYTNSGGRIQGTMAGLRVDGTANAVPISEDSSATNEYIAGVNVDSGRPVPMSYCSVTASTNSPDAFMTFTVKLKEGLRSMRLSQMQCEERLKEEMSLFSVGNYVYCIPYDSSSGVPYTRGNVPSVLLGANGTVDLDSRWKCTPPMVLGCIQDVDRANGSVSIRVSNCSPVFDERLRRHSSDSDSLFAAEPMAASYEWLFFGTGPSGYVYSTQLKALTECVTEGGKYCNETKQLLLSLPSAKTEEKSLELAAESEHIKDESHVGIDADDDCGPFELSKLAKSQLNASQKRAVQNALSNKLSLIQGPPGTGKTQVAAAIVLEFLRRFQQSADFHSTDKRKRPRILVSGFSNVSVDVLCKRLCDLGVPKVVRCGMDSTLANSSKYRHMVLTQAFEAPKWASKIAEANVIGATVIGCANPLLKPYSFDLLVIDETTQSTEASLHVALSKLRRDEEEDDSRSCDRVKKDCGAEAFFEDDFDFEDEKEKLQNHSSDVFQSETGGLSRKSGHVVLLGDHKQLPPTILSQFAKRNGLGLSLFERLVDSGAIDAQFLDTQYRMNAHICEFPSRYFYNSKLLTGASVQRPVPAGFQWPRPEYPVCFVECPEMSEAKCRVSKSTRNQVEAVLVRRIVRRLLRAPLKVCVITPYAAQRRLIEDLLRGCPRVCALPRDKRPMVRTVDGFQGSECDVIVFSAVRANDGGTIGFLNDAKRVNVMLTRPKCGLIVIGNSQTLGRHPLWNAWLQHTVEENQSLLRASDFPDDY